MSITDHQPSSDGSEEPEHEEVQQAPKKAGYKNPPEHCRFPPGISGNPKGRPAGRRSFSAELKEVLEAKIVVSENGKKSRVSTTHAMLLRLRQRALGGDLRAIERLLCYALAHLPLDAPDVAEALSRDEEELLRSYVESKVGHKDTDDV